MKKLLCLFLCVVSLVACADDRVVCGKHIPTYGVINDELKVKNINYHISTRNVILAILFSETLFIPGITVGWYLYEPRPHQECK